MLQLGARSWLLVWRQPPPIAAHQFSLKCHCKAQHSSVPLPFPSRHLFASIGHRLWQCCCRRCLSVVFFIIIFAASIEYVMNRGWCEGGVLSVYKFPLSNRFTYSPPHFTTFPCWRASLVVHVLESDRQVSLEGATVILLCLRFLSISGVSKRITTRKARTLKCEMWDSRTNRPYHVRTVEPIYRKLHQILR